MREEEERLQKKRLKELEARRMRAEMLGISVDELPDTVE